jgi:hypothetical protein
MADQYRWDALGGVNRLVKTPNLDSLAARGVRFGRATVNAPMCLPSRYSMMTGLYPSQVGVRHNAQMCPTDADLPAPVLAQRLRDAGYQTAGFGKTHWYLGEESSPSIPVETSTRGFEVRAVLPLPANPTDQYLPPGMLGFRDAEIYPFRPDLKRAKQLAAGRGGKAILWTCNIPPCRQVAELVKANLRPIGIDVEIEEFPVDVLFASIEDPPLDILTIPRYAEYQDPSIILNLLLRQLLEPNYRRKVDHAARLDGLGQVAVAAGSHGLHPVLLEGVGGQRDDGDGRCMAIGLQPLRRLPAVHLRDRDVHEDDVGLSVPRPADPLLAIPRLDDRVAHVLEDGTVYHEVVLVVLDEEDGLPGVVHSGLRPVSPPPPQPGAALPCP